MTDNDVVWRLRLGWLLIAQERNCQPALWGAFYDHEERNLTLAFGTTDIDVSWGDSERRDMLTRVRQSAEHWRSVAHDEAAKVAKLRSENYDLRRAVQDMIERDQRPPLQAVTPPEER